MSEDDLELVIASENADARRRDKEELTCPSCGSTMILDVKGNGFCQSDECISDFRMEIR